MSDAKFVRRLLNEPSFIRYIGDRGVRTLEDARGYIRRGPVASYRRRGFGLLRVELKESGEPIGICGLVEREALPDLDIGFAFLPEHWRKGYACESAAAVLAWGRDVLALDRVLAIVQPDNEGSIRTLRKLGMQFERMIRLSPEEPELQLFGIRMS